MSDSVPNLAPYWYKPEGTDGLEFRLRPLSESQMIEVESLYGRDGRSNLKAEWTAGTMGIIGVRGSASANPANGQPAVPPACFDWLPRHAVRLAGIRLILEEKGVVWSDIQKGLTGEELDDAEKPPEDDPEKN